MPATEPIIDPKSLDFGNPIADIEAIRKVNRQRWEMEQLTAILVDDVDQGLVVGYKDITEEEFWVRGHMPGMPLMPGVIMCEAAAQVCSYHVTANRLMGDSVIGFGGIDEVRFRNPVLPGSRLVVAAEKLKLRPTAMVLCRFQCYVESDLVCEGKIRGIPIPVASLEAATTD